MFEDQSCQRLPTFFVIGALSVSNAPVPHSAGGIVSDDLFETLHCFHVVEGVSPEKTTVEPHLCIPVFCRNGMVESAKVKVFGSSWNDESRHDNGNRL